MSKELTEKWAKETNPMAYSDFLFKQNEDLRKENKRLQGQLNEANELIKIVIPLFSFGSEKVDAEFSDFKRYLIRWGVK